MTLPLAAYTHNHPDGVKGAEAIWNVPKELALRAMTYLPFYKKYA